MATPNAKQKQPIPTMPDPGMAIVRADPEVPIGISAYNAEAIATANAAGEWDTAPRIHKIVEGQVLRGRLCGEGSSEIEDRTTGEVKIVRTWIVDVGGAKLSILSSAQLDRDLPGRIGHEVIIARGPDVRTGAGRVVTEYIVKSRRMPASAPRSTDVAE